MIMMGPVVDIVATVQNVIDLVMDAAKLGLSSWLLLGGGIIYVVRFISFYIDLLLINFIGAIYVYFTTLLDGTMFNEEVVNAIMKNVYVFIGVIVFFRLVMVLLKYIVSPELVSDGKIGATNLVKRVILGMAGIILIPTIFTFANNIQSAFLKDQVIQKIIIPEDLIEVSKKKVDNAGRYIGTYVLGGFLNPSSGAPANVVKKYDLAIKKGDLSSIDVNDGALLVWGWGGYNYNYFIFLSTFVLGYVLFLMIKYCLDLIGRLFKLFVYQLIAPIAMIEYMINGSDNGVFKNWKTAVLSTYFLLFVRVFALWFVVFVMTLMTGDLPDDKYVTGSLLATNDNLLRALIIVALLGFMMDLPKLIGNIFGLDLEQEGSASGLLNSIKGGFAKIAGAGLTMGGAMVGGMVGAAKGVAGSATNKMAKEGKTFGTLANSKFADNLSKFKIGRFNTGQAISNGLFGDNQDRMKARAKKLGTWSTTGRDSVKAATSGVIGAAMKTNQYTAAAYGGYTSVNDTVKGKADKREAEAKQDAQEQREMERDRRDIARDRRDIARDRRDIARDRRKRVETIYESPDGKNMTKEQLVQRATQVEMDAKVSNVDMSAAKANLDTLITNGAKVNVAANLVSQQVGDILNVPSQEVARIVKDVYDDSSVPTPQKAERIVDEVRGRAVEMTKQAVEVEVNQVYGHRKMDTIDDAVQTVHRDFVSTNDSINDTRQVIHQDIEKNIRTVEDVNRNVTRTNRIINKVENTIRTESAATRTIINDVTNNLNASLTNNSGLNNNSNNDNSNLNSN